MGRKHETGIREVAELAGVSFSTAAAALRGERIVREQTRLRVERAAAQLGYRKDHAAALLASRRRGARGGIALAYIMAEWSEAAHGRFENRMLTLERETSRLGYQFERHNVKTERELRVLGRELRTRGIDGIIVGPTVPQRFLSNFPVEHFPVVSESTDMLEHGCDVVRADHFHSVLNLLHRICDAGYKRLLIICRHHPRYHPDDEERLGAAHAFNRFHTSRRKVEAAILQLPITGIAAELPEQGQATESTLVQRHMEQMKADAVIGFGSFDWFLLQQLGYAIPGDIGYAAMLVTESDIGNLTGLTHDQIHTAPLMIERLVEKIRLRQEGLRPLPLETVVPVPVLCGATMPL